MMWCQGLRRKAADEKKHKKLKWSSFWWHDANETWFLEKSIDFLLEIFQFSAFFLFFKSLKPAQLNKNSICNHNTTILGSRSCPQTKIKSFLESWGVSWNNLFHYSHCHRPSRMILFMKRKKRFIHLLRLWKKLIIFWWGTHWALAFSRAVKESFRECYLRWVAAINT